MMSDLTEIKSDVKSNNNKIDSLTSKVDDLESKNKEIEEKTENSLKEIRNEIVQVEENVTNKLMIQIKPSLESMKNEVQQAACQDLRRLVQEEISLQKHKEAKEKNDAASESGDPEKIIKIQKNNKIKNTKKKEEDEEVPEEGTESSEEE